MEYDLILLGDGIFAKYFLIVLDEFLTKEKINRPFSVLQISNEQLAPKTSLKTTATVSLNGIKAGVSDLGDLLVASFHAFSHLAKDQKYLGVEKNDQWVIATGDEKIDKLKTRYENLVEIENEYLFKNKLIGTKLESFVITPEVFLQNLDDLIKQISSFELLKIEDLVVGILDNDKRTPTVKTKFNGDFTATKIVIAISAFAKIMPQLFLDTDYKDLIHQTKVVAGSYLIKKYKFHESFYLTINGHNVVYRKNSEELIIGSTTVQGNFTAPDLIKLQDIFADIKKNMSLDIGEFESFNVVTGLRHKGIKRLPFFKPINSNQSIWLYSGAYKNGWSLPFYLIPKNMHNIFC